MKRPLSVILILSTVALALLLTPPKIWALALAVLIGAGLGLLSARFAAAEPRGKLRPHVAAAIFLVSALLCAFAGYVFYNAWRRSGTMAALDAALGLAPDTVRLLCAVLGGAAALPAVASPFCTLSRRLNAAEDGDARGGHVWRILPIVLLAAQHFLLQYAAQRSFADACYMHWYMFLLNTAALLIVYALLGVITGSRGSALFLTVLFSCVWALANYYVTLFHGSPLLISEFANFKTAMDVVEGYTFDITAAVKIICAASGALLVCALLLLIQSDAKPPRKGERGKTRLRYAAAALALTLIVGVGYNTPAIKPKGVMQWAWYSAVKEYGYVACVYEDVVNRINPVPKPESYSVQAVEEIPLSGSDARTESCPDIILILNESFFDLSNYTDIETDVDYLQAFYSIEGAHYGLACEPTVGGGTNNSETELLTSNSMYLLPIGAPFNYLNFGENKNAIGCLLGDEGYNTLGMHVYRSNYSRHKVYPQIGFQQTMLGTSCYTRNLTYGHRSWTDECMYEDLNAAYDAMGEGPRFIYLLTYQNHGDYERNEPEWDLVHTLTDFGEWNDKLNEYLSSVSLSAESFAALTEHYREADRPVIICMMGDHAPNFVAELPAKAGMSEEEKQIAERAVPYAVWANFELDWPESADYVSLVDLVPLIKQAAGLPLSTYDRQIIDLHEAVPVRLSTGLYRTADGQLGVYDPAAGDETNALIRRYLFMEYNLLKGGGDYRAELFTPGAPAE